MGGFQSKAFNASNASGGGGLSGLLEDQVLIGAADGTVDQDPKLLWNDTSLNVESNLGLRNILIGVAVPSTHYAAEDNTIIGSTITFGGGGMSSQFNVLIGSGISWSGSSSADNNVAIGSNSFSSTISGRNNIGIGNSVLTSITSGADNVGIGRSALSVVGNGRNNIGVGVFALNDITTGVGNIAIGPYAGDGITIGDSNIAIGEQALQRTGSTGDDNIAIGHFSIDSSSSVVGQNNIGIGRSTLTSIGSGYSNIAIGEYAGQAITSSYWNIALGVEALGGTGAAATGIMNIAIGRRAMDTGVNAITGDFNTIIANNGCAAGSGNLTGGDNVVIGHSAGNSIRAGSNNTLLGTGASNTLTGGSQNTVIGSDTSTPTSSSGNVIIGFNVGSAAIMTDELWIDNSNTTTPLIWGDFSTDNVRVNGTFEITEGQIVNTTTSAAGNYVVLVTDFIILKTGITAAGDTVTLPAAPPTGAVFEIIDASGSAGTDNITIDTTGAPLINGAATAVINTNRDSITVVFNGTDYFIR